MKNPWEGISLADYENHMKLDSVMQLQAMNRMMKGQFDTYPVSSVMILGIAGGNGLEHIQKGRFERLYGVDVNSSYLQEVIHRYPDLDGILECLCINLIDGTDALPEADLVITYADKKFIPCQTVTVSIDGNIHDDQEKKIRIQRRT